LANALDAVAGGADKRIEVEVREEGEQVVLTVRDHGPGLSEEALRHLFEPFFTTKPPGEGLGLGLALSADVIREMGGELSGRNHPEGGAEFTLRLTSLLSRRDDQAASTDRQVAAVSGTNHHDGNPQPN
jgi:C4-dicarboxylate-specific signal transduction histidine kinase